MRSHQQLYQADPDQYLEYIVIPNPVPSRLLFLWADGMGVMAWEKYIEGNHSGFGMRMAKA